MDNSVNCSFCRATLPDAKALEEHELECVHREWWLRNLGDHNGEPEKTRVEPTHEACAFCGYEFHRSEVDEHSRLCGQRRWMDLNFPGSAPNAPATIKRPPPLEVPELPEPGPGLKGFLERVVRGVKGPDERFAQMQDAFRRINAIRDDETFAVCRPAMAAVREVLDAVYLRDAPPKKGGSPLPLLVGMADKLARVAEQIERKLDDLLERAPMKLQRQLEYIPDPTTSAEAERIREQLRECDLIEAEIADLRLHVREVAANLEASKRRFLRAPDPAEGVDDLAEGILEIERHLAADSGPRERPTFQPAIEAPAIQIAPEVHDQVMLSTKKFAPGNVIAGYHITGIFGGGGMGIVLDARSPDGRRVALKAGNVPPRLQEQFEARFQRECRILKAVQHPGCVRLLDAGRYGNELYLVMEAIEGIPLGHLLAQRQLTLQETIGLGLRLCDPIAYLHEARIVHRDLKPDNIIIKRDGSPVIADFGISKMLDGDSLTQAGAFVGTPAFVAPEAAAGGPITAAADQWSLGRLLFECVCPSAISLSPTRVRALVADGTLLSPERFPSAPEWTPLGVILSRMLALDPQVRYPSVIDVRVALEEIGGDRGTSALAGIVPVDGSPQ